MTSKIVVNNIESDSGIGSVTFTSDIELGTKNLKGHNLESTGIVTATSFSGSGASLTNIPAGNLTGTLPALDGSALTGVGVGTADSINTSGIITATSFVPTVGQLSHRNLVINGDLRIAQRATTSTSTGFQTVDRFETSISGTDETPTQSQVDVASGTTPYTLGFRKAFKITNGNQTSGTGTSDRVGIEYKIEAQDIANCGWNYLSSSSYITFSYWVKSSVAQNFYVRFKSADSPSQAYAIETGSLSADTWTKITKTIPGNSNIVFNNDNGEGLSITWEIFRGTSQTGTRPLNAWAAADNNTRTPDQTSTWYTTNDATFEITGVQLEVGPVATPFEHRSFGEELSRCHRYYNKVYDVEGQSGEKPFLLGTYLNGSELACVVQFPKMRTVPTLDISNGTNVFMIRRNNASDNFNTLTMRYGTTTTAELYTTSNVSGTGGQCGIIRGADTTVYIAFSAEL